MIEFGANLSDKLNETTETRRESLPDGRSLENMKENENHTRTTNFSEEESEEEEDEFVRNLDRRNNYDENDEEKCTAQEYEIMKVSRFS